MPIKSENVMSDFKQALAVLRLSSMCGTENYLFLVSVIEAAQQEVEAWV